MINWSVIPLPLISKWFNYIASQSEANELAAIAHFIKLTDNEKIAHGIAFLEVQVAADMATLAEADALHAANKATLQASIEAVTVAIAALQAMLPPEEP